MSSNSELGAEFRKLVEWYVSLPPERQTYILTQWFQDTSKLPEEEREKFTVFSYIIRQALLLTGKKEVTATLVTLGIEETLAMVIVERIDRARPTPHMHAQDQGSLRQAVFLPEGLGVFGI